MADINPTTVSRILSNEKYKGDTLLQKSYTVDFLTKKKEQSDGEIPQHHVENNHEPIIYPEVFDMAQRELKARQPSRNRHSGVQIFSGKINCGECGSWYGSKAWHSNSKYRPMDWQCDKKFKGDHKYQCQTPHLDEETIKKLLVTAMNKLLEDKEEIVANFEFLKSTFYNTSTLES